MASASWSDKEMFKLNEIWGDKSIEAILEGCKRNRDILHVKCRQLDITRHLSNVRKLKSEYRKMDNRRGRKKWTFFLRLWTQF